MYSLVILLFASFSVGVFFHVHFVSEVCFISTATNICFSEKGVYTQEVLAVVLQQLSDYTPVPVLFMRTVMAIVN